MQRIAITGGVAEGKTTVLRMFESLGASALSSDSVAATLLLPGTEVWEQLVKEFGQAIIAADGALARERLATLAFGDPAARRRLNRIMHPAVVRALQAQLDACEPSATPIFIEVPLLVEVALQDFSMRLWWCRRRLRCNADGCSNAVYRPSRRDKSCAPSFRRDAKPPSPTGSSARTARWSRSKRRRAESGARLRTPTRYTHERNGIRCEASKSGRSIANDAESNYGRGGSNAVIRRWRWYLALAGLSLTCIGYAQGGTGAVEDPYRDRPGRHVLPNATYKPIPPQNYKIAPPRAPQESNVRWRKDGLFDPQRFHQQLRQRQQRTRAPRWDRDITNAAPDEMHPVYNPGATKMYFSSNAGGVGPDGRLINPPHATVSGAAIWTMDRNCT
jgi:dephospho-CoA kinase